MSIAMPIPYNIGLIFFFIPDAVFYLLEWLFIFFFIVKLFIIH